MLRSYVRPYERSISTRHHYRKAAFTGGLQRVRIFMLSYVEAIEEYSSSQSYLKPLALPPDTVANLEETQDPFAEAQPQNVE